MYIKWTEVDRINLVETVIKVEAEKWRSRRRKWDRILSLLPAKFQEKTWNVNKNAYNVPKCETMFSDLLHAYRCKLGGKAKKPPLWLTDLVCTVLKRYVDLRNRRLAIRKDECFKSGRPRDVKTSSSSRTCPASSTLQRPARLEALTPARTRIQSTSLGSSERPPSDYCRRSSPMTRATSINTHSRYEGLHSNFDGPLSRLDLEFSELGKWVQEQLIPYGEKMANEVITSAIVCAKRRKFDIGTAAVPIGDPLHDSRSRWFGLNIRASFQQLRVQFAKDLKKTSLEIAEVLLRDTH